MYMQRWRRCPTHQHNHLTRWPSTTTATSQPTQPPWLVGFILFLFSCFFFFLLINIAIVLCTCNDNYDGWTINTNHLTPRPSTMTAMSQPTQPPWSVGFFFFFFFFLLYYFTNKYCYSLCTCNDDSWPINSTPYTITINDDIWPTSTTTQRWLLTHQLNHTTQLLPWPSTMTATSQPTQPLAQHDDHRRLRRLAKSLRRLSQPQPQAMARSPTGLKQQTDSSQVDHSRNTTTTTTCDDEL